MQRTRKPGAPGTGLRRALAAAACALPLAACDFPTAAPIFESRIVMPAADASLPVAELLPATLQAAGGLFTFTLDPVAAPPRTLAAMCGAPCIALEGQTVPKPAFSDTIITVIALPADVAAAALASGAVDVRMSHTLGFDPLRPAGAATNGRLVITARHAGTVIGRDSTDQAFPSGTSLVRTVTLEQVTLTEAVAVEVALHSPAGGAAPEHWVTVNNAAALALTAEPRAIMLASARVAVTDRQVGIDDVALDLSGIDDALRDRTRSGALVVTITNPFDAGGVLELRIANGGTPITKPLAVAACAEAEPCTTTVRVEFTEEELDRMLGQELTLSVSGPVSAPSGYTTVRPTQEVTLATRLDLVLFIGGDGEDA